MPNYNKYESAYFTGFVFDAIIWEVIFTLCMI